MVFQNLEIAFEKEIIWSVLQKWDECNKNSGLTDCLRAFLLSVVLYSNQILYTLSSFLSPILALEADLKNNGEFRFDISKSIKIDINLPNKNFQFHPLLELYFAPRWGGHEKKWQIWLPHPEKNWNWCVNCSIWTLQILYHFLGCFGPQVVQT